MRPRRCIQCRSETEITAVDAAAGEAKTLTIAVKEMPVAACARGHRQFVHPEFPLRLVEHLIDEDEVKLPAGEEKGLLVKHYHCAGCGAELAPQPDHRHTFTVDVALADLSPFRVELTMPVYRCPSCDKEQLHSLKEIRKYTPEALAQAFKAAGIPAA